MALGLCIGLLIGVAQVILKEAWVKVEAGFRPGRELIVSKGEIVIGRAESCDIGLFGDNSVERTHARILRKGDRYLLVDSDTAGGHVPERPTHRRADAAIFRRRDPGRPEHAAIWRTAKAAGRVKAFFKRGRGNLAPTADVP